MKKKIEKGEWEIKTKKSKPTNLLIWIHKSNFFNQYKSIKYSNLFNIFCYCPDGPPYSSSKAHGTYHKTDFQWIAISKALCVNYADSERWGGILVSFLFWERFFKSVYMLKSTACHSSLDVIFGHTWIPICSKNSALYSHNVFSGMSVCLFTF